MPAIKVAEMDAKLKEAEARADSRIMEANVAKAAADSEIKEAWKETMEAKAELVKVKAAADAVLEKDATEG